MATVNDRPLISAWVNEPRFGRWVADVQVSGAEALEAAVVIDIDGVTWGGTTIAQSVDGSRLTARVVGGGNGMNAQLPGKWYRGASTVQNIVTDILRECGESYNGETLSTQVASYERLPAQACDALRAITERYGLSWRITRPGLVSVVADTYQTGVTAEDYRLIESNASENRHTVAVDAPTIAPGDTLEGELVVRVQWYLGTTLRGDVYTADPSPFPQADASTVVSAGVDSQNADGSLDVIAAEKYGMTQVPFYGLPGALTLLPDGSKTLLAFLGADQRRPVAFAAGLTGGVKLGTLLLAQNAMTFALLPAEFFPAGPTGDAAATAAAAVITGAGNVAQLIPITTDTVQCL